MKNYSWFLLFILSLQNINAQQSFIDSLKQIVNRHKEDTTGANALTLLSSQVSDPEERITYANQGLALSKKINYKKGEANCNLVLASLYSQNGYFIQAIQYALAALESYETLKDNTGIASAHLMLQAN